MKEKFAALVDGDLQEKTLYVIEKDESGAVIKLTAVR